ncbi:MAG: MarR family transcriptional regulator [Chloroflexota bacterium]|nr:MarR family transcriptional regulator [Dehalococcoidia bacterium]MDW8253216.1 MarR family transcriptional regulator [Chloroflexota bacterium]
MAERSLTVQEAEDRFILHWGEMAQAWGINKTMGQVHGLLFVTGREWSAEEIVERLQVSRGNVSVTLRNLVDWGLVRRFHKPGERREYFASITDIHKIFQIILAERKRREFDPTLREVEALVRDVSHDAEGDAFRARLADLLHLLRTLDLAFACFVGGDLESAANLLKEEIEPARR